MSIICGYLSRKDSLNRLHRALLVGLAALHLATPGLSPAASRPDEYARLKAQSLRVTVIRDRWGIAHVRGRSDADTVFGIAYAQAEDNFEQVENNYLRSLGRLSEAEGEASIWADLRQRLFIDPEVLQDVYRNAPEWLKALMQAWADGLNYYLATHPHVRPRVLSHFEPWMSLSFTEGSVHGDVEKVPLSLIQTFYGRQSAPSTRSATAAGESTMEEGSNGVAIGPLLTKHRRTLLLINPHTDLFFRSEMQATSEDGLNAYGAVTWGQFFVYQGFNETCGWMHTSSGAQRADRFAETVETGPSGALRYKYGAELRPVVEKEIVVLFRDAAGSKGRRAFRTFRTHHGPVVGEVSGKWIAVASMDRPVLALEQSFLRMKAANYASFMAVAALQANSSNNTVFADVEGNIAYMHPQFVPIRDDRFDYRAIVDGSNPQTDWKGVHTLDEVPHLLSPKSGWVMNTNDAPWNAAGSDSLRARDFPGYMDVVGENSRGVHATMLLRARRVFTPRSLIAVAYDSYVPELARQIPYLVRAYNRLGNLDPMRVQLAGPVRELRTWDYRWAEHSVGTTVAVLWAQSMWEKSAEAAKAAGISISDYVFERATDAQRIETLAEITHHLEEDFGRWSVPWGKVNRLQRRDSEHPGFDDTRASIAVPFTSAKWGSLAAFETQRDTGTRKYYGVSGNSFVAVVEFGRRVRAWTISAGGASALRNSRHFDDQDVRYAKGKLKPVDFYLSDLLRNTERSYHPGQ